MSGSKVSCLSSVRGQLLPVSLGHQSFTYNRPSVPTLSIAKELIQTLEQTNERFESTQSKGLAISPRFEIKYKVEGGQTMGSMIGWAITSYLVITEIIFVCVCVRESNQNLGLILAKLCTQVLWKWAKSLKKAVI